MCPVIDHGRRHSVKRTALFSSFHVMTSSVIYYTHTHGKTKSICEVLLNCYCERGVLCLRIKGKALEIDKSEDS